MGWKPAFCHQRPVAVATATHALGQYHGQGAGRGVNHAGGMGVVVVQPVDEHAIQQRGVAQGQAPTATDDDMITGTGKVFDTCRRARGELEAVRSEGNPDRVQRAKLGLLHHRGGNVRQGEAGGVRRQTSGQRG